MGPRAGLDRRKTSSPPEFDPGPSSLYSVAIPTELPGPLLICHSPKNVIFNLDILLTVGSVLHPTHIFWLIVLIYKYFVLRARYIDVHQNFDEIIVFTPV